MRVKRPRCSKLVDTELEDTRVEHVKHDRPQGANIGTNDGRVRRTDDNARSVVIRRDIRFTDNTSTTSLFLRISSGAAFNFFITLGGFEA